MNLQEYKKQISENIKNSINQETNWELYLYDEKNFLQNILLFLKDNPSHIMIPVIGELGKGKSTFLNMLISNYTSKDKPFKAGQDFGNVTNQISEKRLVNLDKTSFFVNDVPGISIYQIGEKLCILHLKMFLFMDFLWL